MSISIYWMNAFADLTMNIAAAWFGLALVSPSVSPITDLRALISLSINIVFGIMFITIHTELEKFIDQSYES